MNTQKVLLSLNIGKSVCKALPTQGFRSSSTVGLRGSYVLLKTQAPQSRRQFSTTGRSQLEYFPPPKNAPNIKLTPPAWKHPICDEQQMKAINIAHRQPESFSDRWALGLVRILRWGTDLATGYRHDPNKAYVMNERKWMIRFIFLETVAGVPGMVGGMLRHFRSLRSMKRDNGWIETLLEDAYNERMHLLTFLKMAQPGWMMKLLILGAQGVFVNGFFLSYLLAPKSCHRFVGYLEEEAVKTYTLAIQDLDDGKLPAWKEMDAPEIAIRYWDMPEGHRKMKDLLLYIRADEAKHREIHHTFANLNQAEDPNPFVSEYKDPDKPHPGKGIEHIKAEGWERKDVI